MDPDTVKADGLSALDSVETGRLVTMAAPYNPRKISDEDLESLRRSMRFFGVVEPVVVNRRTNRIVGGHQRVKAAEAEGIETLPVVWVDLDEPSEKQLNLALNRISGSWDEAALSAVLAELDEAGADLELTGFTAEELEELLGEDERETDPDNVPTVPDDAATRPGDVIILGEHRLACGDCRDRETVQLIVGEVPVDAVITDPPYGVEYIGKTGDALAIAHDDSGGLDELLRDAFGIAAAVSKSGAVWYITAPPGPNFRLFASALFRVGVWRQTLIWVKGGMVLGHSDYHYQHEPILYGWMPGATHKAPPDRKQTTVWEFDKPAASREHPTMKPVGLFERAIKNSTARGGVVYDPFLGSGTTLIAAEMTKRRCFGVEIEPQYCDVIVRRWQEYTGRKAEGWRGNVQA